MIHSLTKGYERLLLAVLALGPTMGIVYLERFQDASLRFENHLFHEVAIGAAILLGILVAAVTWRCYKSSGERFLYWLALAFLGFALVYLPHGLFTRFANHNIWFFLLYGPASRLVMGVLLFRGLIVYELPAEASSERKGGKALLFWTIVFLLLDLVVGLLAWTPIGGHPLLRMSMEACAMAFMAAGVVVLLWKRITSPLMTIYAIALAIFAQSSLAFFYGLPWNHQWWFAHLVFALGFFLLSFGVAKAFNTTRSFSAVYSQEEMMKRLTEAKEETERALSQLQLANGELVVRGRELEEANQELEIFNYSVAHDLRTPLTVIKGCLDVMDTECKDGLRDRCQNLHRDARNTASKMDRLIDALLEFSMISRAPVRRETVDLGAIAREVAGELERAEPERRVHFRVSEGMTVVGDPDLLRVVLSNLLGNAWKYSRKRERAVIEFGAQERDAEVTTYYVRDNGKGFEMALAEKIFAPFERMESSAEFRGHGIGLATTARIVARHGGRIWAEGEPGKGATFYFTLAVGHG